MDTKDSQKRLMKAELLIEQLEAAGFSPEDLLALRDGGELPGSITLRDFMPTVQRAASAGSTHVYGSYWPILVDGLGALCACGCDSCLDVFEKLDASGQPLPCPCATGACHCGSKYFDRKGATCDDRYLGLGSHPLRAITPADISEATEWAGRRAQKRWLAANRKRANKGRTLHTHKGQCAKEHLRAAASKVFTLAMDDPSTGVNTNVALKTPTPRRQETKSRPWTEEELQELWDAIFTTGSNDAELDMLIVWFHLETGARRGGALTLVLDALDFDGQAARLTEKGGTVNDQPVSLGLLGALVAHAIARGDVVATTVSGLSKADVTADDVMEGRATLRGDRPVFYYSDSTFSSPHALTRRRYNSLFNRLQCHLPWADRIGARSHDIRKTGGQFIERACGYAVARKWLRHSGEKDSTGSYVTATKSETARAFELLTGQSHPLAKKKGRSAER